MSSRQRWLNRIHHRNPLRALLALLCVTASLQLQSAAAIDLDATTNIAETPLLTIDQPIVEQTGTAENASSSDSADHSQDKAANATATPSDSSTAATVLIEPSADQIKKLPFAAPPLRSDASRSQRLARHSQIVHSKVLAWLDLPYAQSTGFRPVNLDLFVPNNSVAGDARLPLLIVLHEGNPQHFHSQYNRHFADTASLFADIAATGMTVAAINYRSPRETNINGQVNDLRAAIRWLEINREDYRLGQDFSLWSFADSGEIVQAYLLHHQQQKNVTNTETPASDIDSELLRLRSVVMWQPALVHKALADVPLLAINAQQPPDNPPANQQWLQYNSAFGQTAIAQPQTADDNNAESGKEDSAKITTQADARLDALSRSLQFIQQHTTTRAP